MSPYYLLNKSVKDEPILIIFGKWNLEEIWHKQLCCCPLHLKNVIALPGEKAIHLIAVILFPKKVDGFENSHQKTS